MKRLLFSLVALALTSICFAQDVLVKKDGSTILAKVLRITETEVEYKNYDNPDGPTRVISISSLLRINYQNGQSETFAAGTSDDIVTKETATKFSDDRKLMQMYLLNRQTPMLKKAKRLKLVGGVVGGVFAVGGIALGLSVPIVDYYNFGAFIATGVLTSAAGVATLVGCCVRAKNLEKDYKYSVQTSPVLQQEFNVGKNERLMVGVDVLNDKTMKHQTVGMGLRYNF